MNDALAPRTPAAAPEPLTRDVTLGQLDPPQDQTGTRFEPVSVGYHIGRFVDFVDLGMQQFKPTDTPRRRICLVLWVAEREAENNSPKFVQFYCSTSLFGGGDGAQASSLMVMLRGISGNPNLTEEQVRGIKLGKLLGRTAGMLIEHKTSRAGKVRANVASWQKANPKDPKNPQPPPIAEYSRPDWLAKRDVNYVDPADSQAKTAADGPLTAAEIAAHQAANESAAGALPEPAADDPIVEAEGPPEVEGDAPQQDAAEAVRDDEVPF